MTNEQMITCPKSGGDACMVIETSPGIKTYFSFCCGYQTNSLMKEGEAFYEEQISVLPELYKDLILSQNFFQDRNYGSSINEISGGLVCQTPFQLQFIGLGQTYYKRKKLISFGVKLDYDFVKDSDAEFLCYNPSSRNRQPCIPAVFRAVRQDDFLWPLAQF